MIRSRAYPRFLATLLAAWCLLMSSLIGLSDWRAADAGARVAAVLLAGFGILVVVRTWLAAAWFDARRHRLVYRGVLFTARIPYVDLVSLGVGTSILLPRGIDGGGVPCYVRKGLGLPIPMAALGSRSRSMPAAVIIDLNAQIRAAGLTPPPVWISSTLLLFEGMSSESLGSAREIKHWWTPDSGDDPIGTVRPLRQPRRAQDATAEETLPRSQGSGTMIKPGARSGPPAPRPPRHPPAGSPPRR